MARRTLPLWRHVSITVEDVIREILPFGSNPDEPGNLNGFPDWKDPPLWALDAFASLASVRFLSRPAIVVLSAIPGSA
jgi:hypothetical protein